jgi:hypothetical protein
MKTLISFLALMLFAIANKAVACEYSHTAAKKALKAHYENSTDTLVNALHLGDAVFSYKDSGKEFTVFFFADLKNAETGESSSEVGQVLVLEKNQCKPYVQGNFASRIQ